MSDCPKCGTKILDERLGCPICSVRENVDYSKRIGTQEPAQMQGEQIERIEEQKHESAFSEAAETMLFSKRQEETEPKQERIVSEEREQDAERTEGSKSVEEIPHLETREHMGTQTKRQTQPTEEKEIRLLWRILLIVVLFVMGTFGATIGVLLGLAFRKSPYESYRHFGKTLLLFGLLYLVLSLLLWVLLFVINFSILAPTQEIVIQNYMGI